MDGNMIIDYKRMRNTMGNYGLGLRENETKDASLKN